MVNSNSKKESKTLEKDNKKITPTEVLGVTQNIAPEDIQKHFPSLYEDLSEKRMSLEINKVGNQTDEEADYDSEELDNDPLRSYNPDIYDFLARAKTDDEGKEIIDFLLKQDQISNNLAQDLKEQINNFGIRSICPERKDNHYFHHAAEERMHNVIRKRYKSRKK